MAVASARTERAEARLLLDQKRRIERAASIKGLSVSDFIVQNADEAAIRTIQQHTSWELETGDRDRLIQELLHPPEPSDRLYATAHRYMQRPRA